MSQGICRSGKRCSISAGSKLKDADGRLVCSPLDLGGALCLYHLSLFVTHPAAADEAIVCFLDLETSGLSVLDDCIVEIGCLAMSGGSEATPEGMLCAEAYARTSVRTGSPVY